MADVIKINKRLIGKEDINFDITGTGEVDSFFTPNGEKKNLTKLNASHFPLTADAREKTAASNIDGALINLAEKINNFSAGDVLTEDATIIFETTDTFDIIQNKINLQKKNLGGHTLTFLFPSLLDQNLYATLEWKDFFNGTIIIGGGDIDNKISIYDQLDITSLFRFYRCQCEVKIQYFSFIHKYSVYAISAESSSAVIIDNCNFYGITNRDSYAVNKNVSNVFLIDCEVSEDIEFFPIEKDGIGKYIGEIFAYPSALPPEGAYLLNGQTITNCQTLYPDFWNWLTSQIGEYETVPIYKAWTQTPLTEDGTMGGSAYACSTDGTIVSGRNVWESFNMTAGNAETICVLNNTQSGSITFYSPVPLRINSVTFTRATGVNAKNIVVEYIISGSNDNSTWTELASGDFTDTSASATLNIPINSSNYSTNYSYKYYKFYGVNNGGTTIDFPKIYLYGEEFVRTMQESNGYISAINAEEYEAEIAEYGACGAFVISGSDVRIPKWNGYQTPLGDSVPVIGNGITMGLTDGANTYGLRMYTPGISARSNSIAGETLVGTNVGDGGDMLRDKYAVGLSTDPTKSGIIADTSGLYPDRWSWVIQVFNTATNLSEQESAQLASQMQMKAQKDLGNVDSNIDFVIDSYDDGQGNWYRVYRSGWVEQGGYVSNSNPSTLITTTFLKSFNNVNYFLSITSDRTNSSTTAIEIKELGYVEKNTTFFTKYLAGKTSYEEGFNWYACGQGAN